MASSKFRQRDPYRLKGFLGAQVDSRGVNPLVDYAFALDPELAAKVSQFAEPPKMFSGGTADVPPFTASGLPPEQLLKLPYGLRHAAAAEPDITKVYELFENPDIDPDATIRSEGLEHAYYRVQRWLEDTDTRTDAEKAQEAAEHDEVLRWLGVDVERMRERQSRNTQRPQRTGKPGTYGGPPRTTDDFDDSTQEAS